MPHPPKPYRHLFLTFLAYFGIGLAITYPLVFNLGSSLYGMPGDNYGTLWSFWWNLGHEVNWLAPAQPTLLAMAKLIGLLSNEIVAYNVLLLLSYPLAGIAIYLIVHHFTNDRAASFLAGFIYILGPYHIYQSYVHLSLAMIAWLPMYLYALLLWLKDPKTWRATISGLLLALVILDNYYYGYLAILITLFFVIGLLIQIARKKLSFWTALYQGFIAAGIAIIIVSPFIIPSLFSGAAASFERPLRELYVFRAAWWDFFIPAITHPLVGKLVHQTTSYELAGSNYFERTLYLGYMPLLLAIIGAWRTKRSWLTYFLLALFVVSIIIATAPSIIAPTLHDWFPTFRVYSRFGLLCLMVTAILAGIGIASLSKGTRSWMLHLAFALFVLADFYPLLPSPLIAVSQPTPLDTNVAIQPQGKTIVYPLASADEVRTNEYLSDSRLFKQPLFNAVDPSYHDLAVQKALLNPDDSRAISVMKRLGISYIIVRKDVYTEGRLTPKLWDFYDPNYPKFLPAWNDGRFPDLTSRPELTQLYDDSRGALYRID